ncbi:NAD-dependent epimerase/dehydratase family protein [Actinoplanes solisilvae]|uniref:NAD-dependent epimerase/dehydratase family protein n=1 Tax=Actinoplanes solisilvae TaxID=2486853 RepID=UPI000FDADB7C|nr:NAD(P)-dependent oxidoreductase [Actinoplanes solisilvae]
MPAHVLVTGAAGLIGSAVLDLLAATGITTTALILEPADVRADRTLIGDAGDPRLVADAVDGTDAVIHLAAIPRPGLDPDEEIFARNTRATFVVLDQAGRRGIHNVAIASSYAIGGLPFARVPLRLPYLPIDAALPLQITDPYALSKRADEATADMVNRRYGTTVVALRLPFVGAPGDRLGPIAELWAAEPGRGAADVWSYLDVRDAARALVAALRPAAPGSHVLYVAAPETLSPRPTEWLLDRFHPGVPRPAFPGRTVPIDLGPARDLLGFTAEHIFPIASRAAP